MQTLSNGYLLPDTGDRGSAWFPAIESNIQRLNDHNHNGSNSEKLNSESTASLTDQILPASWAVQPSGLYRATVSMPGSLEFDTKIIQLRTNNKPLHGDMQKVTSNSFYVFVNDNSLTVEVIYG
mgnify:CR=1 FL=1|tara:strand:- start:391 stop:762 length:372 start_codon:yes stop_codon:yes gene_type:complete